MIDLAIIEDSFLLRESLRNGLQDDFIHSVQTFRSVTDFLWQQGPAFTPSILLLDINLPKINGIEGIDSILLKYPGLSIVIYSIYADTETIMEALSKGAVGYIQKSQAKIEEISEALKIVSVGGSYLSPKIARNLINTLYPSRIVNPDLHLTKREEQVINGLVKGMTYKQIADELIISIDTVRTYIKKIYSKLHVKNKTQLTVKIGRLFHVRK